MRYVEACVQQSWHLMLTAERIEDAVCVPYKCRSWRHTGPCCQWKGAQDFVRVKEAIEANKDWSYLCLTFAQSEWWDWKAQYQLACPMWSALRCRIRRTFGRFGYIQTWERHRKGGLHVNVIVSNSKMHLWVLTDRLAFQNDWLSPNAVGVGFGPVCWAEPLRSGTGNAMAGYLTKLARELVGAGIKCQIPFDAPSHFRRLRASKGMLPPVHQSELTGWLVMKPRDNIDRMHWPICPDTL